MKKIRNSDGRDGWFSIPVSECAQLLEGRHENRVISEGKAGDIAHSISSGNWIVNGETIILDEKGRVLDGQHRLRGAILAGLPLETYVVHINGKVSARSVFDSIDQGKLRGLSDRLKIDGVSHYSTVAAIAKRVQGWGKSTVQRHRMSIHEGRLLVNKSRKEYEQAAAKAHSYASDAKGVITTATLGFVYFMARRVNPERAEKFIHYLATGEQLSRGNIVYALRKRLMGNATASKSKLTQREMTALIVKAWGLFLQQKAAPKQGLHWRSDGPKPEPFPQFDVE